MPKATRSPQARRDAISIWQWVADDSPRAADGLLARFAEVSSLLAGAPEMGRARNDLARGLRCFPVGEYVIFYRLIGDGIDIVRILHGRQDIGPDRF